MSGESTTGGPVPAGCPPDLDEKLQRLAQIGAVRGLHTLVLQDPATLGWLLCARVHVPQTLDTACLDVVVDLSGHPRLTVVTNAIEAPRLRDGELADVPADWQVVPWWASRATLLPQGEGVGSDRGLPGTVAVGAEVAVTRRVLTGHQQRLLRELGTDCAQAATAASGRVGPADTEYGVAAELAARLIERAIDPVVLLVAGEPHVRAHRHPLPTTTPVGERLMMVACGRRHGLVASVTRFTSFGAPSTGELETYERLLLVEAAFLDATTPGARVGDVVRIGTDAYAHNGFAPTEWHRHHQGGFTGSQPREYPAHAGSTDVVAASSAVAWNPSAEGWKVEDTCIVTAEGPDPVVHDSDWPTVAVAGRRRPHVLIC